MPLTALYYTATGVPVTGYILESMLDTPNEVDPDRLFRVWKLLFHDNQEDPEIIRIQACMQAQLNKLGKTRSDLLRDWVALTYAALFQETSDGRTILTTSNDAREMEIEVVVAVPPGRSVIAHEEVLQAFVQGPISKKQVSLVSEPEALFRSWIAEGEDSHRWKVNCFDATYTMA